MDSIVRGKLKQLVQSQHWEAIYAFMSAVIDQWNKVPIKAEDQFNTVWNSAKRDGKVEGLKEFIDNLEKLALDD